MTGRVSTREDFDFMERAGRGASSVVFKARRKADGKVYCVKEIDMSAVVPEEEEQALREVQLLASFEHPYVIRYFDSFLDDEILHIVMEWAEHGTLSDHLKAAAGDENLSETQVWKWSLQIIVGLNHMHARKVLHRDLKSANVFITAKGDAKIGDLGVSRALTTMQEMAHTVVGTPYYLSPELCEGRPYNTKSDVWALGCIMFEMCSGGAMPFQASNQGALILKILSGKQAALPAGRYSEDLDDLITRCLTKAWQRRPDTTEILSRHDVTDQIQKHNITIPKSQSINARGARGEAGVGSVRGGREQQDDIVVANDFAAAGLSRLHSAPAAPQSREGGQRMSYLLGNENDELCQRADRDSASFGDTGMSASSGSSSGTTNSGGISPIKDLLGDLRSVEQGVAAAAGRRQGQRRNMGVAASLQELDMRRLGGEVSASGSDALATEDLIGAVGKKHTNRPARMSDHLGSCRRHPPRPPENPSCGNPRKNMMQAYTEKDMLRSPPGSSRLDDFANDVLNNRPPGRHRRRRDRQFSIDDSLNGQQKLGISTVDLTPKGVRANISQSIGPGGALVRTPNSKGLAIATSPAAFPPWNPPEHLFGMKAIASPCSRLVQDKFGPRAGLTRDDSGIGLRSPLRNDGDNDDDFPKFFAGGGGGAGRQQSRAGVFGNERASNADRFGGAMVSYFPKSNAASRIDPHGARNPKTWEAGETWKIGGTWPATRFGAATTRRQVHKYKY